jgi:hypothetical protein
MFVIIGFVVAVFGVLVPISLYVYEHRRSPESIPGKPMRAGKKQRTIAVWTAGRFSQSLQQFDEYCDRLDTYQLDAGDDPTKPSREDLLRFAEAVLLTAAVDILPYSQGKANLFYFADPPHNDQRIIVSQTFTGGFPPSQVLGGATTYRKLKISHDEKAASVAGECLRIGFCLEKISNTLISGIEVELGTTHIIGMPVKFGPQVGADNFCGVPQRMPAAITVDLRIGWFSRLAIYFIRRFAARRSACICDRLGRYGALQAKAGRTD